MLIARRTLLTSVPAAVAAATAPVVLAGPAAAGTVQSGQSPVDIPLRMIRPGRALPPLRLHYGVTDLHFEYISRDGVCSARNDEETVEAMVPESAAFATLDGTRFDLLRFHFHTPSEHTLDGYRYPAEQHFVHRSADGHLLVLGLFLRESRHGGPVDDVLGHLPEECGPEIELHDVDLAKLVSRRPTVVRYGGSLTTSPFTQGVDWNVIPVAGTASRSSLRRLRRLFPDGNAREVQPLSGRSLNLVRGHH